jgi:hypothetical protein
MKPDSSSAHVTGDSEGIRRPRTSPIQITSLAGWIDHAFDDKRVTIACISIWFFICLGGFTWLGIFGSAYMRVGPSPTLTYMGMLIDTMPRYLAVVAFVVLSTAINDFASDAISPWIQNTVMDHKSRTIPYSKFTMVFISQTWSFYCGTMSVASIALVFAQFDLIMIRLVVDLFVNQYTIRRFLSNKSHDPFRYHNEFLNEDEIDNLRDNADGSFIGCNSAAGVKPTSTPQHDLPWNLPSSGVGPRSGVEPDSVYVGGVVGADSASIDTGTQKLVTPGQTSVSVQPDQAVQHHSKKHRGRENA